MADPGTVRPGPDRRVLLAEDDPLLVALVRATLRPTGVGLLEAGTGTAAVELARTHRPPLVLLDVGLPEMDGWEVCRALKADPGTRGTRVVMLTARASPADRERAEAAGADGYLTKPFSPADLVGAVTEWLG